MKAGGFYNDLKAVEVLIEEGRENVERLIEYGVDFDKEEGHIAFTKEGGHSKRRIVHKRDFTGKEIIDRLIEIVNLRENITCYEKTYLVDVICKEDVIIGALILQNGDLSYIQTKNIVLATGGIGRVFLNSTNSAISTGDGLAIASRAGAVIEDMEFIQFHPTPFKSEGRSFLISEAVRGEGGILRNKAGEAFMDRYHPLKDLAPRDIVSQSILKEQKLQGDNSMDLDVTHFEKGYFEKRFPSIFEYCISQSVDPRVEWIPVNPAEHYLMGGIKTDLDGKTNLNGLFSCGESARTGVQGANRLASNSLREGIVFGNRIARYINTHFDNNEIEINEKFESLRLYNGEYAADTLSLKTIMDQSASILRHPQKLREALSAIENLIEKYSGFYRIEKKYFEFMNMLNVSEMILTMAIKRTISLGSHCLEDNENE